MLNSSKKVGSPPENTVACQWWAILVLSSGKGMTGPAENTVRLPSGGSYLVLSRGKENTK